MSEQNKEEETKQLQAELQYLRERDAAVIHFLYGIAVGFLIYWAVNFERQTN